MNEDFDVQRRTPERKNRKRQHLQSTSHAMQSGGPEGEIISTKQAAAPMALR